MTTGDTHTRDGGASVCDTPSFYTATKLALPHRLLQRCQPARRAMSRGDLAQCRTGRGTRGLREHAPRMKAAAVRQIEWRRDRALDRQQTVSIFLDLRDR